MLKVYNSLTKQKEEFRPITPGSVGLYSCGPTVYDHAHIGNMRAYIFADVLQRTLRHIEDYKVAWVMNITDVDDKMIARATQEYPDDEPMLALGKLADRYTDAFLEDMAKVGIARGDIAKLVRATDHIDAMQQLIRELVDRGVAYESEGSVYFSLSKYQASGKTYGRLVNLNYDGQARVIDDQDQKEGIGDFVLWKAAKAGEPSWEFEINGQQLPGRPGWHIECSAMSTSYLGKPFDIHTGGIDLKFPHHENELAQCGGTQAQYYMHNEFLNISGEKMAKSAKNFYSLADISDPVAFRLLCVGAHYRSKIDFSLNNVAAARNRLNSLREFVRKNQYATSLVDNSTAIDSFRRNFTAALRDDLNTPMAFAALAELEKNGLRVLGAVEAVEWADRVLGLELVDPIEPFGEAELALQQMRTEARLNSDYSASDKLRDELKKLSVESEDLADTSEYWRAIK